MNLPLVEIHDWNLGLLWGQGYINFLVPSKLFDIICPSTLIIATMSIRMHFNRPQNIKRVSLGTMLVCFLPQGQCQNEDSENEVD